MSPCAQCGKLHERQSLPGRMTCSGHRSDDRLTPCLAFPETGGVACRMHGGGTKVARARAAQRRQEMAVQAMAQTLGLPVDIDPHQAILDEIRWSAGHVAFYRAQVQALAPGALVQGVRGLTQTTKAGFQAGETIEKEVGPDVHVWLKLYGEERDRLARLCVGAIKAGIDERRVKIEEQQAAILVQGLTWLQSETRLRLDLDATESRVFAELLAEMLQRLDKLEAKVGAPAVTA